MPLFLVHDLLAFDLLRRVDPSAYSRLLREIPHVEFARQILGTAARTASLNNLAELLRQAPPAFDEQGDVIPGGELAPLVLATCVTRWFGPEEHHPNAAVAREESGAAPSDAEISQILETLSERSDQLALGYAWLQFLIWSTRTRVSRRAGQAAKWIDLLSQIGRSLPTRSGPLGWIRGENSLWRNDRIYALLTVLTAQSPPNGAVIAELAQSCLTSGLVKSYGIEQLVVDPQSCDGRIVGLAVASIENPADWFKQLWATIFVHRDRARRSYHPQNDVRENIGAVAVFWALAGLEQLPTTSPAARTLWTELEIAVRESALTDAFRRRGDVWCIAAQRLAAHWTSIFTDDPVRGAPGSLDDFLARWAEPDADFAYLVAEFARRGVTAAQFKRSIPHGDLLRAAFTDSQRFNERTGRPEPELKLDELATAIDAIPTPGAECW